MNSADVMKAREMTSVAVNLINAIAVPNTIDEMIELTDIAIKEMINNAIAEDKPSDQIEFMKTEFKHHIYDALVTSLTERIIPTDVPKSTRERVTIALWDELLTIIENTVSSRQSKATDTIH